MQHIFEELFTAAMRKQPIGRVFTANTDGAVGADSRCDKNSGSVSNICLIPSRSLLWSRYPPLVVWSRKWVRIGRGHRGLALLVVERGGPWAGDLEPLLWV